MGEWLKSKSNSHRRSGLSNIPENARVEARLFFTLIGHGAWQLAEALSSKSSEMYPGLQEEKRRFSFFRKAGNQLSLPRSGDKDKKPAQSYFRPRPDEARAISRTRSGQGAPFVCKVLLDEERFLPSEVGSSEHLSSRNLAAVRRSWASRRSNTAASLFSTRSHASSNNSGTKASRASRASGFSRSSSTGSMRRMAAISYYPVEKFIDEVPISQSSDRWRYSCLLFLLDPRQEAMGESIISELQRRQQEIKIWLKINESNMQGVMPESTAGKKDVCRRLNAVVIFHRPPRAWLEHEGSLDEISLEAVDESGPEMLGRDQRYSTFLDSVKELVSAPSETLWHYCNFDDTEEVLKCHVKIAQSLVDWGNTEGRAYEVGGGFAAPEFGMINRLGSQDSTASSSRRRCVVM